MIKGMAVSYAVTWEESDGFHRSGRLELEAEVLRLEGQNGGLPVDHAVRYQDIAGYRIARGTGERLDGRPTLIVDVASGDSIKVASVAAYQSCTSRPRSTGKTPRPSSRCQP